VEPILKISELHKTFGHLSTLNNVSFNINKGETFGLVGESGCGKSTLANIIIGIHFPTFGEVMYNGKSLWKKNKYQPISPGKIQIVFQDPQSSLDPRMTVRQIVTEPLIPLSPSIRKEKSSSENLIRLLQSVGLQKQHLNQYPHEFSGGQRQRIAIARSIITDPEVLILDEPTSALDVSVQAQVLNLLRDLQQKKGFTYLFISHNMSVIKYMCDRVGVLYKGNLVEVQDSANIFQSPQHDYTKKLLSSIPGK
jgi:ABC-type oligopeptide transport system ATPase subunit